MTSCEDAKVTIETRDSLTARLLLVMIKALGIAIILGVGIVGFALVESDFEYVGISDNQKLVADIKDSFSDSNGTLQVSESELNEITKQVTGDAWKAEVALLIIKQNYHSFNDAVQFAEAAFENIAGDIESETPQDCVDAEIDAARESL
jgi:hypothetical protein